LLFGRCISIHASCGRPRPVPGRLAGNGFFIVRYSHDRSYRPPPALPAATPRTPCLPGDRPDGATDAAMIAAGRCARWLLPALLALPWQAAVPASDAEAVSPEQLVEARRGDLPIVILAPHGGRLAIPGVAARQTGSRLTDSHTAELANATAERVAALLGARPYTVIARFKRRYLDVNRSRAAGAESARAAAVHDLYHGTVAAFVNEVRERFPGGR
jgi:hypothetical protein